MRWIWIDRFLEFSSGQRARAIKNISLAEEHLHDHFPGFPVMPNSLITEGLAQTGGLLVGETSQFNEKVILAKIPKAVFHFPAVPGDTLLYTAKIEQLMDTGAIVSATSHVLPVGGGGEGRLQAEMEIVFAYLRDNGGTGSTGSGSTGSGAPGSGTSGRKFFEPKNFVFTMRLLGVFEVGRSADGTKLQEPPGLSSLKASGEH